MKIVIINGSGGVGKDRFADFCKKHHENVINWSTIDSVKEIAIEKFNWNGNKTDESRKFLSEMKRIWTEYNNGPFNYMVDKISEHQLNNIKNQEFIYFIHCREPNEIQKFVDLYKENCVTLLIQRNIKNIPNNESDKNVQNYKYDYYIDNNKDEKNLEKEAVLFLLKIIKNHKPY